MLVPKEMLGDIVMLEGIGVSIGALGDTEVAEDIGMLEDDVVLLEDIQVLEQEDNLKLEEESL